jgi:ATP-binding cassette subfamily B protein
MIGERGVTLSGGQKQRTAIAQMLLRQPAIMIFDDSLSAVDAETDAKIRQGLKKKLHGCTVLLISHRITTLSGADRILVLDHGRVEEIGTPEELYEKNGLYRRIFDLQASGREEVPSEHNGKED